MDKKIITQLITDAKKDNIQKIVVGAVIEDKEKILLLERPSEDFMGGIFELPSGNLEPNEDLLEGLFREVKEETNLDVKEVISFIDSFDYVSGSGRSARQFNFHVVVSNGEVKLTEHTQYVWAKPGEKEFNRTTDSVKKTIQRLYLNLNRRKNGN